MAVPIRRIVQLTGLIGVLFYATHVILGGLWWKGYNHLMQPISDLTATGAPNREALLVLTVLYGLFCLMFGITAAVRLRTGYPRPAFAGTIFFILMQLVSLSYGFFPEDLPGSATTFSGLMHYVVTAAIVPLTILTPVLIGAGLARTRKHRRFGIYSIVSGCLIFILGGISVPMAVNKLPLFGLVERLNIGSLMVWTAALSIRLFLSPPSDFQNNRNSVG